MKKFDVHVFECKRDPDMKSERVRVGARLVPKDTIPKLIHKIAVKAIGHDQALRAVRDRLKSLGLVVRGLNFSAEHKRLIVAYVFERASK